MPPRFKPRSGYMARAMNQAANQRMKRAVGLIPRVLLIFLKSVSDHLKIVEVILGSIVLVNPQAG